MKPLSSDRSDNNRWDVKSSFSAIVVAAIAGEWFLCDRWTFFLSDHSDRSDHMETGFNLSQQPSTLPPQLAATCTPYKHIERTPLSSDYS